MGCCGGKKANFVINGSKTLMAQQTGLPGRDGFEVLEYVGNSAGTMTWWGPVTRTRYVFGGTRRVGYVDARDAAGMLQMADQGQAAFRIYRKLVTKPAAIVEIAEPTATVGEIAPVTEAVAVIEEVEPVEAVKTAAATRSAKKSTRRKSR